MPETFVIVGVGGLGSPLALALALSSEARLVLVDADVVDESNLQRQILFETRDVGRAKVVAATEALVRRGVARERLEPVRARFDEGSARALIHDATVVCDGTDDPATKFLVNDVCVAAAKRFVIAGALGHRGQVFAVRPGLDPCYRCLFEDAPAAVETCADAGVLGATCGLVAAWQARGALSLARGRNPAGFQIIEENTVRTITPRRRPDCAACGDKGELRWPRSASPPPSAS